ncbi:MAG: tRNA (N6-threonylcarbamoyladenosine(37)-N6)-methyltransferase TrmO [Deferrisomatales bacterium]|nr:tRNA (N6-threonylcarbamoyladenosine(37)-N6)-methyltransferase TrmO [Deferrisomatales bacterium]
MSATMGLVPIGVVRSPLNDPAEAPRQGREAGIEAEIEVFPQFAEALQGIGARERLLVVCWLHRSRRDLLQVPAKDGAGPPRGVFSTRSPNRPNPLAVYPVELLSVCGTRLRVRGIDAVDGTPVLDLKPRVPRLDD